MKKSIVLGLTATLLTFGPLVAGTQQSKSSKPAASQTMQKQQPSGMVSQPTASTTQSPTTKTSNKAGITNRIQKLRGTVDNVSSDQLSITTKAGNKDTFVLQSSTKNATQAKAGDNVTVWYRESNGQKTATRIAVNHSSAAAASKKSSGATPSAANTKAKSQHPMTAHH